MTSLDTVRARFARDEGLPFAEVLTEASILGVLSEHGVDYRDRVFGPVTTIWGFLSQVLSDDDSCRDAVSRVIAHRAASGLAACSPNTASYCNARGRLPTGVLRDLAKRTAGELQAGAPERWKWNGRRVFIADGTHVSMPDTRENQASYPQAEAQRPGLGFPLARLAVLLSLATGACHDLAIAPYAGKGTGETTLLRQLYGALQPGDVVLADALFDDYFIACELRQRGVELVARARYRRVGTRTVRSGPDGDLIVWRRPNKPHGMKGEQYRTYPKSLVMRQVVVDARHKGNRVEQFRVVTTILDASIGGGQIGDLYERRWEGEVNIRSVKSTMKMDVLRCKTPEMVRKEIWAHLLAYNLLRTVTAVAAAEAGTEPRKVSFKGGQAGGDGVRPEDRGGAAGGPGEADRRAAGDRSVPPRRRPPRPVGAAGAETSARREDSAGPQRARWASWSRSLPSGQPSGNGAS
jgi:hypothetical protein